MIAYALTPALPGAAHAADAYPNRAIRLIVPFAPGGAADIIGRTVGDTLAKDLGQPVLIVNRDGAGTVIGVDMAAKSAPDGYTLLVSGDAAVINSATGTQLPYDLTRDLTPVSLLYSGAQILLVGKDSKFRTLKDLIEFGKANPRKIKFGSSGVATSIHLSSETFNKAAGIEAIHVPYRGVAPALVDLAGGRLEYVIAGSSAAVPAIDSGQARALAITSTTRSEQLPDLPTLKEQGVPLELSGWYGLLVPAGTPTDVVNRLNQSVQKALTTDAVKDRFKAISGAPRYMTAAEAKDFMTTEIDRLRALTRELGIKVGVQ